MVDVRFDVAPHFDRCKREYTVLLREVVEMVKVDRKDTCNFENGLI
jgi:hypothetical protein